MKKIFFDLGPGKKFSESYNKDLWEGYEIIGLEPDATRYANLKDSFPGILLNLAVSDKNQEIFGIIHDTSGFIAGGYPGYTETTMVNAVTLDSVYEKYGPADEIIIWADIEGSELKMLRGATEVLKKTKKIIVELHTCPKTTEWCNSTDVYNYLINLGFVPDRKEKPQTEIDSCYDATFIRE